MESRPGDERSGVNVPRAKKLRHGLSSLPGLDRGYIIEIPALKRWAIIDGKSRLANQTNGCTTKKWRDHDNRAPACRGEVVDLAREDDRARRISSKYPGDVDLAVRRSSAQLGDSAD